MALKPPLNDRALHVTDNGRPSKEFYNWIKSLFDAVNALTRAPTTVARLPDPAANIGARLFVTDATATTFASVVAGTGANKVPVYSTGADWRIG